MKNSGFKKHRNLHTRFKIFHISTSALQIKVIKRYVKTLVLAKLTYFIQTFSFTQTELTFLKQCSINGKFFCFSFEFTICIPFLSNLEYQNF